MLARFRLTTVASPAFCIAVALAGCRVGVGSRMPDWTLSDTSGKAHAFSDYNGKIVVLDFWATWCAPCAAVSPHMQKIHDAYADRGVVVLAVHYDDEGEPERYMKRKGHTFTVLDDGLDVARRLGVSKLPTVMIIDPDGRVAHRQTGFAEGDEQQLIAIIDRLIRQRDA